MTLADRGETSFTATRDGDVIRVTVIRDGLEGYGAGPDTMHGVNEAFGKAVDDLDRRTEKRDADQYRAYWASVTDRSPREIYTPQDLDVREEDTEDHN